MNHSEIEFANLKKSIKTASSRLFGASHSKFDMFLYISFGIFVTGAICFALKEQSFMSQMPVAICVTACAISILSTYRTMIPFVLRISYSDMLRIRLPFYVWICCVFLILCMSEPFLVMAFSHQMATIEVMLAIISICQAIEYYRNGKAWHLFAASLIVGVTVGFSAFGLYAIVLSMAVSFLLNKSLTADSRDWLADEDFGRMRKRMSDPNAKTMKRMISTVCFLGGMLAVFAIKYFRSNGAVEILDIDWLKDLSMVGIMVVVSVGVIPLLFALTRIERATDTTELFGFNDQAKYFIVGFASFCFLLFGNRAFEKMNIFSTADFRYWLLGMAIAGLSLLLSAMAAIVDVWCRIPLIFRRRGASKAESMSTLCRTVILSMPIMLVLLVLFVRCCGHVNCR